MTQNIEKQTAKELVRGAFTRVENVKQWRKGNVMAIALWKALER